MRLISEIGLVGLVATAFVTRPGFSPDTTPYVADQGERPPLITPDDTARLPGINVSHYQGEIGWQQVRAAGIAFAYAKATEGVSYADPRYNANLAGATAVNLPFGAYHFYSPGRDPIVQADHFLNVAHVGPGSLPPVLDVEKVSPTNLRPNCRRGSVLGWTMCIPQPGVSPCCKQVLLL